MATAGAEIGPFFGVHCMMIRWVARKAEEKEWIMPVGILGGGRLEIASSLETISGSCYEGVQALCIGTDGGAGAVG